MAYPLEIQRGLEFRNAITVLSENKFIRQSLLLENWSTSGSTSFSKLVIILFPEWSVTSVTITVAKVRFFFSWTTLGILLKFALCHFDDYDDYLEHFQLLTSI